MGIPGLWNVLRPAGRTRSLIELSTAEGFEENSKGHQGYRISIDASIWICQTERIWAGKLSLALRTLFFRCAKLIRSPFLPLFVFDGPMRPSFKRGKRVNKELNPLVVPGMKDVIEAFGFDWIDAPGEAEAELSYMNHVGIIDGVLSDDIDTFLFGAKTVIRNSSENLAGNVIDPALNAAGKIDKDHTKVYKLADITSHPRVRLTRGGMILIGLMKGGDYHRNGISGCGITIAYGLALCGFGDSLYKAAQGSTRHELECFLPQWRRDLGHELLTNSQHHVGKKYPSLAKIPDSFPDINVLLSYVKPMAWGSMGKAHHYSVITWRKEPDIGKLARICHSKFGWRSKEVIADRFRSNIWDVAVMRILRRMVLFLDEQPHEGPSKKGARPVGASLETILKFFTSAPLATAKPPPSGNGGDEDEDVPLFVKIVSSRSHISTDNVLEYRLEIAPAMLVHIAESGIKGQDFDMRPAHIEEDHEENIEGNMDEKAEGSDKYNEHVEEHDRGKGGARVKKSVKNLPGDPNKHAFVWVPACMVRIVEPALVAEYEACRNKLKHTKRNSDTACCA